MNKYLRDCPYSKVDVYRVLEIFQVTNPAIQHAVKKLLCTGIRGGKDFDQDLAESIQALTRLQEMRREEAAVKAGFTKLQYTAPVPQPFVPPTFVIGGGGSVGAGVCNDLRTYDPPGTP